ncbi:MAG: lamin tail domain-containing protein, partial [Bacteroidota bacterium]|nr:lamin tail domain-containing protein [Bacteroidota bacterium]
MTKFFTLLTTAFFVLLFQVGISQNIVITEVIQNPAAVNDSEGEWFEIYNAGTETVDINGFTIMDAGSNSHTIENGSALNIEPGSYLVLGINADNATNGGVDVDYQYSNFTLGNSEDEIMIYAMDGTTLIDEIAWDDGVTFPDESGASMTLNPDFFNTTDNDNGANWYPATTPYGDGDLGTPGANNDTPPAPTITVHTPNGGEIWMQGTTEGIIWESVNFSGNIKIEIEGIYREVLVESMENTGYYSWNIPEDFDICDCYVIAISDADDGEPHDESDAAFSIIESMSWINQENFDDGLGTWTQYSVTGDDQIWNQSEYEGKTFAKMTGYDGGNFDNEDWLISPVMNFNNYRDEIFNFESAQNYDGAELQLMISTDYDGTSNPNTSGEWTDITDQATWSDGSWNWVASGSIDLSSYNGNNVHLAFVYTSTTEGGKTWELDNLEVIGEFITGIDNLNNQLSIFPNPSDGIFTISNENQQYSNISIYSLT